MVVFEAWRNSTSDRLNCNSGVASRSICRAARLATFPRTSLRDFEASRYQWGAHTLHLCICSPTSYC